MFGNPWIDYLKNEWGISARFASHVYNLLYYLNQYGISFTITSGFRDPKKQLQMQKAWDAGNRKGLVARPASNSLHTKQNFLGRQSDAIDLRVSDQRNADYIARQLGLGVGSDFNDPGHYYYRGA